MPGCPPPHPSLPADRVCREEDESGGYVMPRASLVQLAQLMPRDLKELRRALGKAGSEVRRVVHMLHNPCIPAGSLDPHALQGRQRGEARAHAALWHVDSSSAH